MLNFQFRDLLRGVGLHDHYKRWNANIMHKETEEALISRGRFLHFAPVIIPSTAKGLHCSVPASS
jgi:hypothetical protein